MARRDSAGVRLITRAGNDFSRRFPFIAMAVDKFPVRSCLIDGEAIVCDENGLAVFELIRRHGALASPDSPIPRHPPALGHTAIIISTQGPALLTGHVF